MLYSTHGKTQNQKKGQIEERKKEIVTIRWPYCKYFIYVLRIKNKTKMLNLWFHSSDQWAKMRRHNVCQFYFHGAGQSLQPSRVLKLLISCSSLQSLGSRGRWSEFTGVSYVLINYDFISNTVFLCRLYKWSFVNQVSSNNWHFARVNICFCVMVEWNLIT